MLKAACSFVIICGLLVSIPSNPTHISESEGITFRNLFRNILNNKNQPVYAADTTGRTTTLYGVVSLDGIQGGLRAMKWSFNYENSTEEKIVLVDYDYDGRIDVVYTNHGTTSLASHQHEAVFMEILNAVSAKLTRIKT